MGTIIHRAAIVTSWNVEHAANARAVAGSVFGAAVSGLISSPINGYWSFLIASSGSKLGWEPERDHEQNLRQFKAAMDATDWHLEIVFVRYGEIEAPEASLDVGPTAEQT